MYENEAMLELRKRHPEVDFYIQHLPVERREVFEQLRDSIHAWVPMIQESLQYRMPTFITTSVLCALGTQRRYIGLYICNLDILDANRDHFSHLSVGRSCIRFNRLDELPLDVIGRMLQESEQFMQKFKIG